MADIPLQMIHQQHYRCNRIKSDNFISFFASVDPLELKTKFGFMLSQEPSGNMCR